MVGTPFFAYLRLVRLPILVLIALIQILVRYGLMEPMLELNGFGLLVPVDYFALTVLATVLVAAGGYAINDYFDIKIDWANKPKTVIVGRLVKRRVAMAAHIVLTFLGIVIGSYASWRTGLWELSSLYLFAALSLWFYSTSLKNQFITGNVVIALMAAMTVLMVGLYEIPLQNRAHADLLSKYDYPIFNPIAFWVIGYSVAIFILTLAREIIKDVVDIKGDKLYGSNSIPIRLGVMGSKWIVIGTYALFAALVTWAYFEVLNVHSYMGAAYVTVILFTVYAAWLVVRAKTKSQFSLASVLNNALVILLILTILILYNSVKSIAI